MWTGYFNDRRWKFDEYVESANVLFIIIKNVSTKNFASSFGTWILNFI